MKNNPKYVRSLQKSYLLDQFYMNLIPYSRYARTVLNCEKNTLLREFLDEPDTPLTFEWPPWDSHTNLLYFARTTFQGECPHKGYFTPSFSFHLLFVTSCFNDAFAQFRVKPGKQYA